MSENSWSSFSENGPSNKASSSREKERSVVGVGVKIKVNWNAMYNNIDMYKPKDQGIILSHRQKQVESEIADARRELLTQSRCQICVDREKNVVFLPCGHTACRECANRLYICHQCRQDIRQTNKLHY